MDSINYLYIGAGIIALFIILYSILTAEKKKIERFKRIIQNAFGVVPQRTCTEEELSKIARLFEYSKEKVDYFVDDITWNDFHGDDVFAKMNHTFSSPGEEVLYAMLRMPTFDEEELKRRDEYAKFFAKNEKIRQDISLQFARIGHTRKFSLIDFLDLLQDLNLKSSFSYLVHLLASILSIVFACFSPKYGVVAFILVLIWNIYCYYKNKADIESDYVALSAMAYLVDASSKIVEHKEKEIEPILQQIREILPSVISLKKDYKWLGNGGNMNMSQDIVTIILDFIRMMTHYDFYKFNQMVKKVQREEENLLKLFHLMGYLEAMVAISSYRATLPYYCTIEVLADKVHEINIEEGYHPLISSREPVPNSICEKSSVLITGSNASGKSTFLRMTGLCALLGQTVNTIHAKSYAAPFYRIYSSMSLSDSIQTNESYYMVEIRSMKRIMDATENQDHVLVFVDEVLRGTNTVERIAASSEILKKMADGSALVFAATHDIELTEILNRIYSNYHFTETIEDDAIHFTFRLLQGPATTRNAIKLLQVMGYDEGVVTSAEKRAKAFVEERKWQNF